MDTKNYGIDMAGKIGNPAAKLKELYDREFAQSIRRYEAGEKSFYYSQIFGNRTRNLAAKLLEPYEGGMAGERGGLTTGAPQGMGMKVGEYAILMLEAVYRLEEKLLPELAEKLEPEIEEYVRQKEKDGRVSEAVKEEKERLLENFKRHMETESEHLHCTGRMVKREYLKDVCGQTRKYFEQKGVLFRECFPELEEALPYDARVEDKGNLAIVKYAAWKLMAAHLHLEDTES